MTLNSMTTAVGCKLKRNATEQPADRASKQQKQAIEPRSSNDALGDYPQTEQTSIQEEKQAVANSLTSTNQEQSPFLRLPAEIRIRIYEFTLGGNEVVIYSVRKPGARFGTVFRCSANKAVIVTFRSTIKTCRAFHAETELLQYSTNSFFVRTKRDFYVWLQRLDAKKRAALRSVCFNAYYIIKWNDSWCYSTESFGSAVSRASSLPGASRPTTIIVYVNQDPPSPIKEAIDSYARSAEWQITIDYQVVDDFYFYLPIYCRSITEIEAAFSSCAS